MFVKWKEFRLLADSSVYVAVPQIRVVQRSPSCPLCTKPLKYTVVHDIVS